MTADDMQVVDELLADAEMAPPTLAGEPTERRHRRHRWFTIFGGAAAVDVPGKITPQLVYTEDRVFCQDCGKVRDEAAAKRGKAAVMRSKREERGLAKHYQGVRTGHHGGPDDVQTGLLNIQSKAGTGWWSTRYAAELDKLPRTGGRVPALIVSNGKPGHLVRRYVVMEERDYRAMYGDKILDGDRP